MGKVIRISDRTISVLCQFKSLKLAECDDPLLRKGFEKMSDDDLIRFVFEDLLSISKGESNYENKSF